MDVRLENEYRNYTDKYNLKETLNEKMVTGFTYPPYL